MKGSIHILSGPMWSGKTSELMRRCKVQRIAQGKKHGSDSTLLVKFAKDQRYSADGLSTHDGNIDKQAIPIEDLSDIDELMVQVKSTGQPRYTHIYIDEGQFFKGLKDYALRWALLGKIVTIAALDAYGNAPYHDMWKEMKKITPFAVEYIKLLAVCFVCGEPAPLTIDLCGNSEKVEQIAGKEQYSARCIEHADSRFN